MWTAAHIGLLIGPQGVQMQDLRRRNAMPPAADLAQALDGLRGSRARLSVLLSDAFCRYAVAARPPGVRNAAELQAAAQGRFRAMFGDVDHWRLQCHASAWSELDFVAGVDGALYEQLLAAARAAQLRVVSLQPLWLAWAAHFQRQTRRGRHWVVAGDGAWLGVGYLEGGVCQHARALRSEGAALDLEDLLARERAFVAGADAQAPVWLGGSSAPARLASGAAVTALARTAPWAAA